MSLQVSEETKIYEECKNNNNNMRKMEKYWEEEEAEHCGVRERALFRKLLPSRI
jgi:ribosomal protein S14